MAENFYARIVHQVDVKYDDRQLKQVEKAGSNISGGIGKAGDVSKTNIVSMQQVRKEATETADQLEVADNRTFLSRERIILQNQKYNATLSTSKFSINQQVQALEAYDKKLDSSLIRAKETANANQKIMETQRGLSKSTLGLNMSMLSFTFGVMNMNKMLSIGINHELFELSLKDKLTKADKERVKELKKKRQTMNEVASVAQGLISITQMYLTVNTLLYQKRANEAKALFDENIERINSIKLKQMETKTSLNALKTEQKTIATRLAGNQMMKKNYEELIKLKEYDAAATMMQDYRTRSFIDTSIQENTAYADKVITLGEVGMARVGDVEAQNLQLQSTVRSTSMTGMEAVANDADAMSIWGKVGARITDMSVGSLGTLIPVILGAVMTAAMVYQMAQGALHKPTGMATGGIVYPISGGHTVNVAENGQPEKIVPLTASDRANGGGGVTNIYIQATDFNSFTEAMKNGNAQIVKDMGGL